MAMDFLKKQDQEAMQRKELKRLEGVLPQFMVEYRELCARYRAQLVAAPNILSNNLIQLTVQLDSYDPEKAKADDAAKKLVSGK